LRLSVAWCFIDQEHQIDVVVQVDVEVAELLDMSLNLSESGGRGLIFRNPCIKNALELDVGISQHLLGMALLERVPYLLGRVLALNKLGDIW
jgi:hypothetical protein